MEILKLCTLSLSIFLIMLNTKNVFGIYGLNSFFFKSEGTSNPTMKIDEIKGKDSKVVFVFLIKP